MYTSSHGKKFACTLQLKVNFWSTFGSFCILLQEAKKSGKGDKKGKTPVSAGGFPVEVRDAWE